METSSHPAAAHFSQAGPSSSVSETNMLVPGIPGLQPNIQMVLNQYSLNTGGRHLARHLLLPPFPGSSTVYLERNPTPSVYLNHLLQLSINEQHRHLGSCVQGIRGPLFPSHHHPPLKSSIMDSCAFYIPGPSLIAFLLHHPLTPHNAWPWPSLCSWGHHMAPLLPAPLSSLS